MFPTHAIIIKDSEEDIYDLRSVNGIGGAGWWSRYSW